MLRGMEILLLKAQEKRQISHPCLETLRILNALVRMTGLEYIFVRDRERIKQPLPDGAALCAVTLPHGMLCQSSCSFINSASLAG